MKSLFLLSAISLGATFANAQDFAPDAPASTRPTRSEARLIGLVAKVTFNEAGSSEADLAMLWNVVEGHGETADQRYHWLRLHSPCVSGVRSQDYARNESRGNCRWSRNLHPDGRRPRGWDRGQDGRWIWVRDRWLAHIQLTAEYVRGRGQHVVMCPETPTTWDGARWREQIIARGFEILDCKGNPRNLGVRRASRGR